MVGDFINKAVIPNISMDCPLALAPYLSKPTLKKLFILLLQTRASIVASHIVITVGLDGCSQITCCLFID